MKYNKAVNNISPPSVNFLYPACSDKSFDFTLFIEFFAFSTKGITFSNSTWAIANICEHSASNFLASSSFIAAEAFSVSAFVFSTVKTLTSSSVSFVAFSNWGCCSSICFFIKSTSTLALFNTFNPFSNLLMLLLNSFVFSFKIF